MKKNVKYLAMVGVLSLVLAGCGNDAASETETESKTKVEESVEKTSQSANEPDESASEKKEYNLADVLHVGSYNFLIPEKAYYDRSRHGKIFPYDGYRVGISTPIIGSDDFDASSIETFIDSTQSFLLKDLDYARSDIRLDYASSEKTYLNLNTPEKADIEGKDAYFVHGVVGNETRDIESYIVVCYVMDEEAPFYVYGVEDPKNPGPEDELEDFLKAIINTAEVSE